MDDTVILANGHTVTVAAGTTATAGNSAAPATPAIQTDVATNGTGRLIVDTGATLTVKAMVIQGNANWTFNAGSTLNFLHATTNLEWRISDGVSSNALTFNGGTGANRITVQSTGAAKGFFTGVSFNNAGMMQATGVQFTSIGAAAVAFLKADNFSGTTYATWFDDCLFTSCGKFNFTNNYLIAGSTFRLRRCTLRSSVDTSGIAVDLLVGNGTHTGVVFDTVCCEGTFGLVAQSAAAVGIQWSNVVLSSLGTAVPLNCSTNPPSGTFDATLLYNKIQAGGSPSQIMNGTITNFCSIRMYNLNPHAMTIIVNAPTVIDTGIWEFGDSDETGDELQIVANPSAPTSLLVQRIICPVCPDGLQAAGSFLNVSHAGTSGNNRITMQHCTVAVSMQGATPGGGFTTENTTGGAGMAQGIQSNLWYRTAAGAGWGVYQVVGVLDADTFLGADYNGRSPNITGDGYNPLDVTFGKPDVPGGHDQVADPLFLDESRRLLSWGKSILGSITTIQQVVDELFKRNDDAGYTPAFTIAAYIAYVRAGFVPRNPQFYRTGHDETTIGAVPMTLPVVGVLASQQRMR